MSAPRGQLMNAVARVDGGSARPGEEEQAEKTVISFTYFQKMSQIGPPPETFFCFI